MLPPLQDNKLIVFFHLRSLAFLKRRVMWLPATGTDLEFILCLPSIRGSISELPCGECHPRSPSVYQADGLRALLHMSQEWTDVLPE